MEEVTSSGNSYLDQGGELGMVHLSEYYIGWYRWLSIVKESTNFWFCSMYNYIT